MEFRLRNVILIGFLINFIILFVNFYVLNKFDYNQVHNERDEFDKRTRSLCKIEIWSKASIGDYLWQHIMNAKIQKNEGSGYYRFGRIDDQNLSFKFRSGYSITPNLMEDFIQKKLENSKIFNLILILNGRTKSNVQTSETYLNQISKFKKKLNLVVILLGNEFCFNDWVKKHLRINDGSIDLLFIVYDWKGVDNVNIFQWPLGVATYRNFPLVQIDKDLIKKERVYVCNYIATIYRNSSREELLNLLKDSRYKDKCLINARMEWKPNESEESLTKYQDALRNSDLTLSPLGMNHECYRTYEALSYLSAPIIEENLEHVKGKRSNCDQESTYRLLKEFNAPVKFIHNWTTEVKDLLLNELDRTAEYRQDRRIELSNWYDNFKTKMKNRLFKQIKERFHCL